MASSSSSAAALLSHRRFFFNMKSTTHQDFPQRWVLFSSISRRQSQRMVIVSANKKRNNKKIDSHSFAPKPDEATGIFPEAILLKEKTVREDGQALPEFADAEEEMFYEFLTLQRESDFNLERMRHYEVVYLIHENCIDEVESVTSKVQDFVREQKGRIWRLNNWGLRRLAYKIRKAKNAVYILMNFELDAKLINDFKSMLDKDERIIRHLVMKQDKAITEDCPPPLEWHTVRAEQGFVDDGDEDANGDNVEDEDWDDETELEMTAEDATDEENGKIIIVDNEDDGNLTFRSKTNKKKFMQPAR